MFFSPGLVRSKPCVMMGFSHLWKLVKGQYPKLFVDRYPNRKGKFSSYRAEYCIRCGYPRKTSQYGARPRNR